MEALDVGLESLLGEVLTARVDRDTNGACELARDTSGWSMSVWAVVRLERKYIPLSSTREKPRPGRTRRLYLIVGQRTTGLSLSTGLGATFAALATRALRLDFFLPGYLQCQNLNTGATTLSKVRGELPGRSARGRSVACQCQHYSIRDICTQYTHQSLWKWFFWICWLCLIAIVSDCLSQTRQSSLFPSDSIALPAARRFECAVLGSFTYLDGAPGG